MQQAIDICKSADVESKIIAGAIAIWKRFYGKPRASGRDARQSRRDLGCPRQKPLPSRQKPSVDGWAQEQRAKIGRMARAVGRRRGGECKAVDMWTAGHDREMDFLKDCLCCLHCFTPKQF